MIENQRKLTEIIENKGNKLNLRKVLQIIENYQKSTKISNKTIEIQKKIPETSANYQKSTKKMPTNEPKKPKPYLF